MWVQKKQSKLWKPGDNPEQPTTQGTITEELAACSCEVGKELMRRQGLQPYDSFPGTTPQDTSRTQLCARIRWVVENDMGEAGRSVMTELGVRSFNSHLRMSVKRCVEDKAVREWALQWLEQLSLATLHGQVPLWDAWHTAMQIATPEVYTLYRTAQDQAAAQEEEVPDEA